MFKKIPTWIKHRYHDVVNSIAFYPAFIALIFLLVAYLSITVDFSEYGKQIKASVSWLSLKDASTARVIISTVVAGILSLTVFSFSMVMIVLNQAASQMSNRILDKLIGNRFQQVVLGIYIGTIVFALFLLSTIRDIDSHIYIPALSTYLLIVITIFDIFLFIYFLHYITQSVKYEVIISRIYSDTKNTMALTFNEEEQEKGLLRVESNFVLHAPRSGIFEGFDVESSLTYCKEHDLALQFLHAKGTFLLKNQPVALVSKLLDEEAVKAVKSRFLFHEQEQIEHNYFYGFKQLMEIALKALSPGINDPGTAILSMRSLFILLLKRCQAEAPTILADETGQFRILTKEISFGEIFEQTVFPIWDYGKEDRSIRREMLSLLQQLSETTDNILVSKLLREVKEHTEKSEK